MDTTFKRILLLFVLILLGGIIVVSVIPTSPSETDYQKLSTLVKSMNDKLPRKIGTIGQFDKVSLFDSTLTYHYSIYGNSSIYTLYEENYELLRELLLYTVVIMNGQNNAGTILSTLLTNNALSLGFEIKLPNGDIFYWQYEGHELLNFISKTKMSPTEALLKVIDAHICLTNLSLPLNIDEIDNRKQSIISNAIIQTIPSEDKDKLLKICREEDNIIFIIETNEKESSLDEIKSYAQNLLFINNFCIELAEDKDFIEFLSMLAIAHSDFTFRFRNPKATDSADVRIPYSVLKKHCSISTLLD